MRELFYEKVKNNVRSIKRHPTFQFCKMLYLWCFLAGFVVLLVLGKEFLNDVTLLNINSLKRIKNFTFNKNAFLWYIQWRRLLILGTAAFLWWYGLGKWFLYITLGCAGFSMGACMYICLLRYRIKGMFLWFFLYFPHALFYGAVLVCMMMLSTKIPLLRTEKIKFLLQNGLWILLLLAMFIIGIYMECYVNVALLQDYLQFF